MAKTTICMTPPRPAPVLPADEVTSPYYPTPTSALGARLASIFDIIAAEDHVALTALLTARPWLANTRVNADGNTPLMAALEQDMEPAVGAAIINTLFQNSDLATLNRVNSAGESALHIAADNNLATIAYALIQAGAIIDVEDGNGYTAFDSAIEGGNYDTANILARAGADIDSPSNPLIKAYQAHHNALFQTLVARGADLTASTEGSHMNLMMMAAIDNNHELIQYLNDHGVDVNITDAAGRTALSYAAAYHQDAAILKLSELGAVITEDTPPEMREYILSIIPELNPTTAEDEELISDLLSIASNASNSTATPEQIEEILNMIGEDSDID